MNGKLVCVLVLMCVASLVETDAWRIRIRLRRIFNAVTKPLCTASCAYGCTALTSGSTVPACGLGCSHVCGRKKRSFEINNSTMVIFPMPREFAEYDTNKNGHITIEEFGKLLDLDPTRDDVKETFSYADTDGDELITENELLKAPWVFDEEPDD